MVIDSMFLKCCASCVYGDDSTTYCRKKDRYNSQREFDNSKYCKFYKSVYELINKKGCPRCHRHGNIILDCIQIDKLNKFHKLIENTFKINKND